MFAMTALQGIAESRGDGPRPELLDLLVGRQALASRNVAEIARHRGSGFAQAGPNPGARQEPWAGAENVIPFPAPAEALMVSRRPGR